MSSSWTSTLWSVSSRYLSRPDILLLLIDYYLFPFHIFWKIGKPGLPIRLRWFLEFPAPVLDMTTIRILDLFSQKRCLINVELNFRIIVLQEQHFGLSFFFWHPNFTRRWWGFNLCGFLRRVWTLGRDWWIWLCILESFVELLGQLLGQKGWFLLVLEPEPIVCEMTWSLIAYVRDNYLKLCSQAFVSSNHVSTFDWKAPF